MAQFKNNQCSRRRFNSQILGGVITLGFSPSLLAQSNSFFNDEIDWYNAKDIGVEGKGWADTLRYFDGRFNNLRVVLTVYYLTGSF